MTIGTIRVRCNSPSGRTMVAIRPGRIGSRRVTHRGSSIVIGSVGDRARAPRRPAGVPDGRATSRPAGSTTNPCCRARRRWASQSSGRSPAGRRPRPVSVAPAATRSWKAESDSTAGDGRRGHEPAALRHERLRPPARNLRAAVDAGTGPVARRERPSIAMSGGSCRRTGPSSRTWPASASAAESPESTTRGRPSDVGKAMLRHPFGPSTQPAIGPMAIPAATGAAERDRTHSDDPDQAHGRLAGLLDRQLGGPFQDQGRRAVLSVEDRQRRPFGNHAAVGRGSTRPLSIASSQEGAWQCPSSRHRPHRTRADATPAPMLAQAPGRRRWRSPPRTGAARRTRNGG